MTASEILEIVLDCLKDSAIVFGICFIIHVLLSFIELKTAEKLKKGSRISPLFGALFGLVPECGLSIIASDLYIKEHITMGTLVAVFLSCSDEASPLMIAGHSEKTLMVFLLVALKFVIGFVVGFLIDMIYRDKINVHHHLEHCTHQDEVHSGCCNHAIDDEKESKVKEHLIHPIIHSLKVFAYVFVINLIFGFIIALVGEETMFSFLSSNKYLSPLLSAVIGIIPNCASSVVITEVYMLGGIPFGAMLSGLLMNSGLGLIYLLKNKKKRKNALIIIAICFSISVICGYLTCAIMGF